MGTEILTRRCYPCLFWLLACMSAAVPVRGGAVGGQAGCRLWAGTWQLDTWGYSGGGVAAWVNGPQGIRLEVMESALPGSTAMDSLWHRQGRGWTLVLDDTGAGVVGAWDGQWRPLDRELGNLLARLVAALAQGDPTGGSSRLVIPGPEPGPGISGFHARLTTRGLGQGGSGEVITLVRQERHETEANTHSLRLSSSRRPGRIGLALDHEGSALGDLPPEFFSPLWPLAEFFAFPAERGELSGRPRVEGYAVLYGRQAAGAKP